MRRLSRRALLLAALATAALADPVRAQDRVAAQLRRLEDQWAASDLTKDTVAVARMLASTYVTSGPDGRLLDRAQQLQQIRTDSTRYLSAANAGYRTWVYGTTAIITGVFAVRSRAAGRTVEQRFRWIDTWVQQTDGRWLCVASMGTRVAQ